jgi:gluconokinase
MATVSILMGVSGCGKSTIGSALATETGGCFIDADDLHPPRNVAKMRAGTPLTDEDRGGWLDTVAQAVADGQRGDNPVYIACSALKKSYRDILRKGACAPRFVYLHGSEKVLRKRLDDRKGHYMPASLLRSQLEALEPPSEDERILTVDISPSAEEVLRNILGLLSEP